MKLQPNVPLLRKAVEWVESQAKLPLTSPEREWFQGTYVYAPDQHRDWINTMRRMHHKKQLQEHEECGSAYCVAGYIAAMDDPRYARVAAVKGVHAADKARQLLGITVAQSDELFAGTNKARDIRAICEEIAGEAL